MTDRKPKLSTLRIYKGRFSEISDKLGVSGSQIGTFEEMYPYCRVIEAVKDKSITNAKVSLYSVMYYGRSAGVSEEYLNQYQEILNRIQNMSREKPDKGDTQETLEPEMRDYRDIYNEGVERFSKTHKVDDFILIFTIYPLIDPRMGALRNVLNTLQYGKQRTGNYYSPTESEIVLREHKSDKNGSIVRNPVPPALKKIIGQYVKFNKIELGDMLVGYSYARIYSVLSKYGVTIREVRNFQVKYYEGEEYREISEKLRELEKSAKRRGHTTDVARRYYAV